MSKKSHVFFRDFIVFALLLFAQTPAQAQITPDNTLGTEASRVTPNVLINGSNADRIDGGASRGINLFHSFGEFNIGNNQRVYFSNPIGIENILTRVTGGNASNILGNLGVNGAANLFLINPNGILFGPNASLDVRGSFVGTTANSVQFGNQGFLSATNPEAPPLLTINPNALFYNQINPNANITNQSQAPAGINPNGDNTTGLRVPDGKSFLLVGGNINLDGGSIRAYDGRVELTGLAAPGSIGLNAAGDNLSLGIPQDIALSDVFINNNAVISLFGSKGGVGAINASNIGMNSGYIYAGIAKNKGTPTTQAGDVNLNVTDAIALTQGSVILNIVDTGGSGNAGDIGIDSGSLTIRDNGTLLSATFGQGNAGDILLRVRDRIYLSDAFIASSIAIGGVGNGGEININAGSLSLTDSSQIQSRLEGTQDNSAGGNLPGGRGNAGDININVTGNISFSRPKVGNTNGIISSVGTEAVGNGGNVIINAENLEINSGSQIQGSTFGQGKAGDININTRGSLLLDGRDGEDGVFSRIIVAVQPNAEGNAGKINITTGDLKISNGAFLTSSSFGQGNAGDITIETRENSTLETNSTISSNIFNSGEGGNIRFTTGNLLMTGGSQITTNVLGQGNAGDIIVNARDTIRLDDITGDQLTGIQSSLLTGGSGKSGNIEITTGSLFAENGAELSAATNGQGDSGNITVNARDIVSFDSTLENRFNSIIQNTVGSNAIGNGGNIKITAREVSFSNGSQINAASFGAGNAGNINIDAREKVSFADFSNSFNINSSANTFTSEGGIAGNIAIKTGILSLSKGGNLSSFSNTNAGNITINASNAVIIDGVGILNVSSGIDSTLLSGGTNSGKGGDIEIATGSLSVSNGGQINASTFGNGNGGNISVNARDAVIFDEIGSNQNFSGVYSLVGTTGVGNAGTIKLTTNLLSLNNSGRVSAATQGQGNAGEITINADNITASGVAENQYPSGIFSTVEANAVGRGGNIRVNADNLTIRDRAAFRTNTLGQGDAGSFFINTTGNITLKDGSVLNAGTFGQGNAGDITLNVGGKLTLEGISTDGFRFDTGIFTIVGLDAGFSGQGKGGNLNLTASDISLNRAAISASSIAEGSGGNINIKTGSVRLDGKSAIASITNSGDGGNIDLIADKYIFLRGNSFISTTAGLQQSGGDGGNITISTPAIVAIPKQNNDITANAFTGKGGNINIQTQALFGIEPRLVELDATNDITASSQLGVQGQVSISEPDVNPAQGIIELPQQVDDKSDQIGSACSRASRDVAKLGEFTITGRGNLSPSILEPLTGQINQPVLAKLPNENITQTSVNTENQPVEIPSQIVEAQGWIKTPDGQIKLVSNLSASAPRNHVQSCLKTN